MLRHMKAQSQQWLRGEHVAPTIASDAVLAEADDAGALDLAALATLVGGFNPGDTGPPGPDNP